MRVVLAVLAVLLMPAAASAAVTKQELRVPMRDGVELAIDVYLPEEAASGARVPVILTLTPYHDLYKGLGDAKALDGYRFTGDGYAFVVADVRGTYESGGCWDYGGIKERQDGYDLVEWLGTQAWSSGKVAMIGASYDGTTANAAAVERPPHLATIVPISSISRWYGYAFSQGVRRTYSGEEADIDPPADTPADFMFAYGFLPPPEPGSLGAAVQIAQRWTPCDRADADPPRLRHPTRLRRLLEASATTSRVRGPRRRPGARHATGCRTTTSIPGRERGGSRRCAPRRRW